MAQSNQNKPGESSSLVHREKGRQEDSWGDPSLSGELVYGQAHPRDGSGLPAQLEDPTSNHTHLGWPGLRWKEIWEVSGN